VNQRGPIPSIRLEGRQMAWNDKWKCSDCGAEHIFSSAYLAAHTHVELCLRCECGTNYYTKNMNLWKERKR
jgi:hypothetical protein